MDSIKILISKENGGKTIKEFLKGHHVGRGRVESVRTTKSSFLNNQFKPIETKLNENDILEFKFDEQIDFVPENMPIDIVYEDEFLLAVNKPSGLIIHPDDKTKAGTLVNRVAYYYQQNNINRSIRYLHRIDKDTTGLVLFAKDFFTEATLLQDIENNEINRKYIALVDGVMTCKNGIINEPIGENRHKNCMCVSKNGKPSKTEYTVLRHFSSFDEVLFTLYTGRTHQIRVHSAYINHPILGDFLYGKPSSIILRPALHCYKLSFEHPIFKRKMTITAPLPKDLKKILLDVKNR